MVVVLVGLVEEFVFFGFVLLIDSFCNEDEWEWEKEVVLV